VTLLWRRRFEVALALATAATVTAVVFAADLALGYAVLTKSGPLAAAGDFVAPASSPLLPPFLSPSPSARATSPSPRPADPNRVAACGSGLCLHGGPWFMYGASEYESQHNPAPSGIDNAAGTVALAGQMKLNTIRIINFYDSTHGKPEVEPYNETMWKKVDTMVAAAQAANMHVLLDLSDYRNILWRNCIDPYGWDWGHFISFVASRTNTVTGAAYGTDRTIAMLALAGEPQKVGTYDVNPNNTGSPCSITYTTDELTKFYARTLGQWRAAGTAVPAFTGGLGYLNFDSGIDWKTIFANPDNAVCGIKTYGRMIDFVPTVADYCNGMGKPIIDEEFGWQQSTADAARAAQYTDTMQRLRGSGVDGALFWNLGYELKPQSYEINPSTPLAFAAVQAAAP
jgi:hypothetical protein